MPSEVKLMIDSVEYKSKKGETFEVSLRKKQLTDQHNYWLYFIVAKHKIWGKQSFSLVITKQQHPQEELADHLAKTLAFQEAKNRLDDIDEHGKLIQFPFLNEGWALL